MTVPKTNVTTDATMVALVERQSALERNITELRAENVALRAQLSSLLPDPPVTQHQTTTGRINWEEEKPSHRRPVMDLITRPGGCTPEELSAGYAQARAEIAALPQNMPGGVYTDAHAVRQGMSDAPEHQQRRAMDAAGPDRTRNPIAPGGVMTKHPNSTQITTNFPSARACPSGHPAEGELPFCSTCGEAIGSPELGSDWGVPDQDTPDARRRRIEEGVE